MSKFKNIVGAGIIAASLVAGAAQAAIVTFAGYSQIGNNSVKWTNNGTGNAANASNGTGGTLTSATSQVNFYFLNLPLLPGLGNILANWTLSATVVATPAVSIAIPGNPNYLNQALSSVTFSYRNVNAVTVAPGVTIAAGSCLLCGTFSGNMGGFTGSSAGSISGSTTQGNTVVFNSDFVGFFAGSNYDVAINLTSVTNTLFRASNKALRSFKASSSGTFSSDPAPFVPSVPEPASWALMIIGFGMVGVASRRRKISVAA